MIDCALISSDDTFRRLVRGLVQQPDSYAREVLDIQQSAADVSREALAGVLDGKVRVAFVDLGETLTGIRVLEAISQDAPEIVLVVAGPQVPADALLRVMRAGASEYLPRPVGADDVEAAFARVRRRLAPSQSESQVPTSIVSTFFSAKGGTGVTTIATNVAVALRELTDQDTLLIDLSALGTAALQLGMQPRYSFLDVIQNFHRIDSELFRSFLDVHETGLSVLASSPFGDEEEQITSDQILGLVRLSRRHFPHVVVDAGNRLTPAAFTTLMESDERLLVANADLPTLRNLRRVIDILVRHNGKAPPAVILNRFDSDIGLTLKDVQQALRHDVSHTIDEDPMTVREAGNLGRPAVLDRKSRFARHILAIGSEIAGPGFEVPAPETLLRSLLRPLSRKSPQKER